MLIGIEFRVDVTRLLLFQGLLAFCQILIT